MFNMVKSSARLWWIIGYVTVIAFANLAHASTPTLPDLYEASLDDLRAGLDAGHFTSVDLVKVPHSFSSRTVLNYHRLISLGSKK
jgi:hypothetical protein